MAISSVGTKTETVTQSQKGLQGLTQNFDQFLTLLTTQLKNQDPTSPMETNEFTNQLVGFSQVEQAVNSNKNLEKLIELSQNSMISNAVSYIDKFAEAETDKFNLRGGKFVATYELPKNAESLSISITDKDGKVVGKVVPAVGGMAAGTKHTVKWDGKDLSGQPVKDGQYKINVTGKDAKGADITGTTYITDLVTAVDLEGDAGTTIYFNSIELDLGKVRSIKSGLADVETNETTTPTPTPAT